MFDRQRPDRLRILLAIDAAGRPMTTFEVSRILKLDLDRTARAIHELVREHCLETGPMRDTGFAWLISEVGQSEADRGEASFTGEPLRRRDPDDDIDLNMRRIGG